MAHCRFPEKYNGSWYSRYLLFEIKSVQFNDTDTYTFGLASGSRIMAWDLIVYGKCFSNRLSNHLATLVLIKGYIIDIIYGMLL